MSAKHRTSTSVARAIRRSADAARLAKRTAAEFRARRTKDRRIAR